MSRADRNTKAEPGFIKRRNRISGQFAPRLIEMLESPAWRVLSLSARKVINRIEIELAHHGGNDNGRLPVTKRDFMDYGVSDRLVAPAIREAEALGFIRVTERGRGGNSEYRQPNLFFLTFAHCRTSRAEPRPMIGVRSRRSERPRRLQPQRVQKKMQEQWRLDAGRKSETGYTK